MFFKVLLEQNSLDCRRLESFTVVQDFSVRGRRQGSGRSMLAQKIVLTLLSD